MVAGQSKKRGVCEVCYQKNKVLKKIYPERLKGADDYGDYWEHMGD